MLYVIKLDCETKAKCNMNRNRLIEKEKNTLILIPDFYEFFFQSYIRVLKFQRNQSTHNFIIVMESPRYKRSAINLYVCIFILILHLLFIIIIYFFAMCKFFCSQYFPIIMSRSLSHV